MKYKLLIALYLASINSNSQNLTTSSASVTIVTPVTISEVSQLRFGNIKVSGLGSVTVPPNSNERTFSGEVVPISGGSEASNGKFNVSGTPHCNYNVSTPDSITLTNENEDTLEITNILIVRNQSFNQQGLDVVGIGGTINITNSQLAGTFQGSFTINVEYN